MVKIYVLEKLPKKRKKRNEEKKKIKKNRFNGIRSHFLSLSSPTRYDISHQLFCKQEF